MRTGELVFQGTLAELRGRGARPGPGPHRRARARPREVLAGLGLADVRTRTREVTRAARRAGARGDLRRAGARGRAGGRAGDPAAEPGGPVRRADRGGLRCQRLSCTAAVAGRGSRGRARHRRPWLRLLRSELRLIFRRRRNLALLAVLAAIPVLIGVALKLSAPAAAAAAGPAFLGQVTGNGVFLALRRADRAAARCSCRWPWRSCPATRSPARPATARCATCSPCPAGRTRLLAVKYAAVVIFCLAACLLVAAVALIVGVILFPIGPVTLLSGTTVPLAAGAAPAAARDPVRGRGDGRARRDRAGHLHASPSTRSARSPRSWCSPWPARSSDAVPQLSAIHPYLPTHWWLSFDALLRSADRAGRTWRTACSRSPCTSIIFAARSPGPGSPPLMSPADPPGQPTAAPAFLCRRWPARPPG